MRVVNNAVYIPKLSQIQQFMPCIYIPVTIKLKVSNAATPSGLVAVHWYTPSSAVPTFNIRRFNCPVKVDPVCIRLPVISG